MAAGKNKLRDLYGSRINGGRLSQQYVRHFAIELTFGHLPVTCMAKAMLRIKR